MDSTVTSGAIDRLRQDKVKEFLKDNSFTAGGGHVAYSAGRKQQVEGLHGSTAGRDKFLGLFLADEASEKIVQQCVSEMALPYFIGGARRYHEGRSSS
jgi:hypothetical protein